MRKGSVSQILARRWWIGLIVFVITFGAVAYLTDQQTPLYSARATYVTRLSDTITEGRDINTALDILNRQKDLLTTYSEVAKSQVIRSNAAQLLDPSGGNYLGLPVSSRVIAGTNLLEISVEGPDPGEVMVYTNAVGEATASYANSLYSTYRLDQLDPAQMPRRPVSPNYGFNLIIGGILGLFIGFGMMLYSLSEMTADPPYRRFEFTNWEEGGDGFLRVLAKEVVCCEIEEEKMFEGGGVR